MKKILVVSLLAMAVASSAFAQGKVNWNTSASAITSQTNATLYSPLFGGGSTGGGTIGGTAAQAGGAQFYWALVYNTAFTGSLIAKPLTLAALGSDWTATGLTATNIAAASRLGAVGQGTSVTVPWAAAVTNNIMMVGWSVNLGTTYAAALATLNSPVLLAGVIGNAYFGLSNTGFIAPNAADPGVSVFGASAGPQGTPILSLNTQLYLVPVPEPGTIALAGLGGLALLALRRKK